MKSNIYSPLVTIIIPVYNGGNFLAEAIDSAIKQTYDNIEIIVVNDGSSDNGESEAIASSYGDQITYYYKENGGVSSALNYALERMHGEWFSWLSHDDLYYPDKIEKQILFLRKLLSNDKEVQLNKTILHSATESIDRNGKVIKRPNYRDVKEKEKTIDVIIDNVYNYRLSGCSFLIPYAAYSDIGGFREDIRTVSDVEYWYRLLFAGYQFYCLSDSVLVMNRSHGKQVGKTKVSLFDKELDSLHKSIADKIAENIEFNSQEVFKKYYYGLIKRNIKNAAKYTKETYIKDECSSIDYYFIMPIIMVKWRLIGFSRGMARTVYRRLLVK